MKNFTHIWPKSGHFLQKLGHFFPIFKNGSGDLPPPFPLSLRAWINNLNELLRKYFLLFKSIAKQTARSTFIQLTLIQSFIHQASYFIISVWSLKFYWNAFSIPLF